MCTGKAHYRTRRFLFHFSSRQSLFPGTLERGVFPMFRPENPTYVQAHSPKVASYVVFRLDFRGGVAPLELTICSRKLLSNTVNETKRTTTPNIG